MKFFILLSIVLSTKLLASTVAVIDSGVDYKHKMLASQMWVNPLEIADNNRDEDHNGYQDDVFGWNFAESNNQIIDYKYIGTFSDDPAKLFAIQARMFQGTATAEDRAWLDEKRKDPNFMKELQKFGNFVHGTHVSGISKRDNPEAKILGVKLIATEVKLPGRGSVNKDDSSRMKILKTILGKLATQQMVMMAEIGAYVNGHKADIANCSFGTGYAQAKTIVGTLYKVAFGKEGTDEELKEPTLYFMNTLITEGQKFVGAAPQTLFVIAAGNDGANNDEYPASPANVKADNSITVAASYDRVKLASFSNYGKVVDVAAPGVIIESSIPGVNGDETLKVSGTSQASPYVANVASFVKDANKALTPAQIKAIIMGTVDKKDFLEGKVLSKGIVNPDRALYAAKLTLTMSVNDAINISITNVADINNKKFVNFADKEASSLVLPLPSLFR